MLQLFYGNTTCEHRPGHRTAVGRRDFRDDERIRLGEQVDLALVHILDLEDILDRSGVGGGNRDTSIPAALIPSKTPMSLTFNLVTTQTRAPDRLAANGE
jgi:hypothetical protein